MMDLPQQFVVKVHPMDGLSSCLLYSIHYMAKFPKNVMAKSGSNP